MSEIVRFSVSVESDLFERFDRFCQEEHFATRSEAVRQLMRELLTRRAWLQDSHDVAGTLTLLYDHHREQLRDQLAELQHEHHEVVVSTMHVHLTHDLCLEVVVLRGPAARIRELVARLKGLKGVHRGEWVLAGVPEGTPHSHAGKKRARRISPSSAQP